MITPKDFLDHWNKDVYGLVHYDEKIIHPLPLSQETKAFLIEAGLPESAPPFLTFESGVSGGGEKLTKKNDQLDATYDPFLYVGFTGSGHPICIDETNSALVYIDYDHDYKVVLINTTVAKFAEALLAYIEFIKKVKAVNGRRAYLECNVPNDLLDWLSGQLQQIDAPSLTEGCFWQEDLNRFIKENVQLHNES